VKVGDLVKHSPLCFDNPWSGGIIIETKDDPMHPKLTQHNVHWPTVGPRWTEEGLLEIEIEGKMYSDVNTNDIVISLRHPFTEKKGTVIEVQRSYGVPDTCTVAWEDGTVSSVWQTDVKVIIESR
tara:strand:- start:615 stop:989 length:375 start_codon:yes stop_codon:yes gene_type:complete